MKVFLRQNIPHPVSYAMWTDAVPEYGKLILEDKFVLAIGKKLSERSALLHLLFPCQKSADTHRDQEVVGWRFWGIFNVKICMVPCWTRQELTEATERQAWADGRERAEGKSQLTLKVKGQFSWAGNAPPWLCPGKILRVWDSFLGPELHWIKQGLDKGAKARSPTTGPRCLDCS